MGSRQDVAGDADHVIHPDGHGALALGDDDGEAGARVLAGELHRQDRLVLNHRHHEPAPDDLVRARERAGRQRACRPFDNAHVVWAQLCAELEVGCGDDDRLGRQRDRLDRHVLHVAIGAEREAAAGGERQEQHEGDAHASHESSPTRS